MPPPYYCLAYRGVACDCGRGRQPATVRQRCKLDARCNELRCASHCWCARNGLRTGRNAARAGARSPAPIAKAVAKAKAKAQAAPAPAAAAAPPPPAPVGRSPGLGVDVMAPGEWYTAMVASVNAAREVIIGSYQYDHEELTNILERRLRGREPFDLTILVDQEMYNSKKPPGSRGRLDRLRRLSAELVLCRGTPSTGSFHAKAVVVDRRHAFVGSANITNKNSRNAELCFRLKGPPVADILQMLHNEKARGFAAQ
jgi:hypothetical protein